MSTRVVRRPGEMQEMSLKWRGAGASIGFVPTMGALHAGHLSLIRRARRENKRVAVSIFVNPLQFGPNEDYARYPRVFPLDRRLCEQAFVDAIFYPSAAAMYPPGFASAAGVTGPISESLEGASRPGHFGGVATVVLKLFEIVRPDRAYFGEKDFQQLRVIQTLSRDLHLPLEVVPCATVREKDGLALSSRNRFLGQSNRAAAPGLYRILLKGRELAARRGARPASVAQSLRRLADRIPGAKLDYLRVVDPETLLDAEDFRRPTRAVLAAWFGPTRLIDNLALTG